MGLSVQALLVLLGLAPVSLALVALYGLVYAATAIHAMWLAAVATRKGLDVEWTVSPFKVHVVVGKKRQRSKKRKRK